MLFRRRRRKGHRGALGSTILAAAGAGLVMTVLPGATATKGDRDLAATFAEMRALDVRLATIGHRLATANARLCDRTQPATGMVLHALGQYDVGARDAARAYFGFTASVAIEGVVPGSPAVAAGLQADDSLLALAPLQLPGDVPPSEKASTRGVVAIETELATLDPAAPIALRVSRRGEALERRLQPVRACRSRFEVRITDTVAASADGAMVQISSRILQDYADGDVAVLVAHELAHNILRHRERLKAAGVDYGMIAGFGRNVRYFRQTELEADIVSVHLLANAGYPAEAAASFWRRFGPEHAGGMFRSRTHPAWRDRVAVMEAEAARLAGGKRPAAIPAPIASRDAPLDGDWQKLMVRR